jgi:hypothetical protein
MRSLRIDGQNDMVVVLKALFGRINAELRRGAGCGESESDFESGGGQPHFKTLREIAGPSYSPS